MRKLMWLTIGFGTASAIGCYLLSNEHYFIAAGISALLLALALGLLLLKPRARIVAMLLFGSMLGFVALGCTDAFYYDTAYTYDQKVCSLTVTARDYSRQTQFGAGTECRVTLEGKSYLITVYHGPEQMLSPGDQLSGNFLLRTTLPQGSKDSGYSRSQGFMLTATARGDLILTRAQSLPWYGYAPALRQEISGRIDQIFPEHAAGFAKALLLGDIEDIDYLTDTALKVSGIRHIVAVSGLHVTILFAMIHMVTMRKRYLSACLGLPLLVFFAAVAGFSPSITRACVMHGMMVLASLIDREYDAPTALSFAVFGMLLVNPWTITDVGFQLSVGCMAGILLFSQRINRWILDEKRLGRFRGRRARLCHWFSTSVAVSLSANVFTVPLCAYYFGMISLIGPVTNLLTLWIVTYIFYGIVIACLLSLVYVPIASMFAWIVSLGISYVCNVAQWLAAIPFSAVYMQSIYIVFWLIGAYLLLAIYLCMRKKRPMLFSGCLVVLLLLSIFLSWNEPLQDQCRVTVLDVGQGQCILLQSEGKNFLVDCGGDGEAAAADAAAGLLLSQGISRLDGLILTHFDADHAAGAVLLLQRIPADRIFLPDKSDEQSIKMQLTSEASVSVKHVLRLEFGDAVLTLIPAENGESDNENGLCVLFQTENCDILITGDRSEKGELALLEQIELPKLELLIVGHHGSKNSTCRELLIKTMPETAIISVGKKNWYGHPSDEVLERLYQIGCTVYRTDLDGTVVYRR